MEKNTVSLRQEFVKLASQEGRNIRDLCRRFGISPKTGYKWLARWRLSACDAESLKDRSRRPLNTPARSSQALEQAVVEVRNRHPTWGARKIARSLEKVGEGAVAPSTVTHILHRHGLIDPKASEAAKPWQRFEHDAPNELWQIDFKGHFKTLAGTCHALTLIDDHSRFNLLVKALQRSDGEHVQPALVEVFKRYGLPTRINADNGAPWGSPSSRGQGLSELAIWLIRLGIRVSFSRPYHPQTNGKLERMHRTLEAEVLAGKNYADHAQVQRAFDSWRDTYNCRRPHEALKLDCPIQHYRPSELTYPSQLPAIEYPEHDCVVTVGWNGFTKFQGHKIRLSNALHKLPVAFRADPNTNGLYDVYFCHQRFAQIDLRAIRSQT
jgi:transposase InsO family protein